MLIIFLPLKIVCLFELKLISFYALSLAHLYFTTRVRWTFTATLSSNGSVIGPPPLNYSPRLFQMVKQESRAAESYWGREQFRAY